MAKQEKAAGLYSKLARKILTESLQIRKGQTVTVETWNNGLDFAREVVKEARRVGSVPLLVFEDEEAYVYGARNMPKDVLGSMGRHEYGLLSATDAYVFIPGPILGPYSGSLTRQEVADSTRYNESWYEAAEKAKLKGVRMSFGYVGEDVARLLGKSADQIVKHQLNAALVDYKALGNRGRSLRKELRDGASATVSTGASRLSFSLKGDVSVEDAVVDEDDVAEGYNVTYVPGGLVSKRVDPKSVDGKVELFRSTTRLGIVEDAVLEFKRGKLTSWKSGSSQDRLDELIDRMPEKSRGLTSLAVGLNDAARLGYSMDRFVAGAMSLSGFGFTGIAKGSLKVGDKPIVGGGRLVLNPRA